MVTTAPALDEPYVGKVLTDTTFTVDEESLHSYYEGLDLERRPGAPVPSTLVSKPDNDYIRESGYPNRFGHLWTRQQWRFHHPLEAGATYQVRGRIQDIYPRRDRNVVQFETLILRDDGEPVAASEHHQSFLREPAKLESVALRDPKAKPGAREFEIPDGERFGGLERKITVEMCGSFFYGKSNYHTDLEASKELGFENIVVGGRMTMAYAAHVLEERFGEAWASSGQLEVKFTNPVWVDDVVNVDGVITGTISDAPGRTGVFVWATRTDGTVVLVGNASIATR